MRPIGKYLWSAIMLFAFAACGGYKEPVPTAGPYTDPGTETVASQPYKQASDGYAGYRIPAIVTSRTGTLLAFAEGRVDNLEDDGNIDIVLKRSTNNGKTWDGMIVVRDDGNNRCQNPAPVVLESGRILLLFCWNQRPGGARRVMKSHSDDDGATWSAPVDIHDQVAIEGYTWYATGPCHAIVKTFAPNKGRIVVPCNHNKPGPTRFGHVIYSDDQGETWHRGGIADSQYGGESTVAELGNGDLMLGMRNMDASKNVRLSATSSDGGVTFQPTVETPLIEPVNNGCQGSLLRYSINSQGASNLLFANPNHESSRRNGTIRLSTNDGRNWTRTFMYVPANTYTSYSDLAVLSDGRIGVLYERGFQNSEGIHFRTVTIDEIMQAI
jgi:sialidase-1